jgi:hypothetical protein
MGHSREDVVRLALTTAAVLAFGITVFTLVVRLGAGVGEVEAIHPDDVGVVDEGLGIASVFDPHGATSPLATHRLVLARDGRPS